VHLHESSEVDDAPVSDTKRVEREPMTGWSILYMWIPAVCDISGTSVGVPTYVIIVKAAGLSRAI